MKRYLGPLLFLPLLSMAGEGGVLETNYAVGLDLGRSDSYNRVSLSGSVNLPVYKYVGSSLWVDAGKADGKQNILDSESLGGGGSLFLRDFDLGEVGVSVSYHKTYVDLPANFIWDDELESHRYSLYGAYYLDDFTFGASRATTVNDDLDDRHAWSASITWYWQEETRLSFSGGGMDAKDAYGVRIAHQPQFFDDSTVIGLSYSRSDDYDAFSIFVSHHFATSVTLKERDRKY